MLSWSVASCSLLLEDGLSGGPPPLDGGAESGSPSLPDGAPPIDGGTTTDADATSCGADVASDPKNCGVCGRVCDGTCSQGVCGLRVEAEVPDLRGLAATPASVAWTTPSRLWLKGESPDASPDGGPITFTLAPNVGADISYGSGGILVGNNSGNAAAAHLCRPDGTCRRLQGGITPIVALVGEAGSVHMLTATGNVFSCNDVVECPTANLSIPKAEGPFIDLAVLGARLYWVTGEAAGKVRSAPRSTTYAVDGGYGDAGSPVTDLTTNLATPRGIATDALGVMWTESASGRIRRCSVTTDGKCAAPPTTLYEGNAQNTPTRIASDGSNIYWIDETAKRVHRCPASGCDGPPVVVMEGLTDPKRIALSLTRVYLADVGTLRVVSAPK